MVRLTSKELPLATPRSSTAQSEPHHTPRRSIQQIPTPRTKSKYGTFVQHEVAQALKGDRTSMWHKLKGEAHSLKTQKFTQQRVAVNWLITTLSGGAGKLNRSQIKTIYKRLREIDTDGSGEIDYGEFLEGFELEDTTYAKSLFKTFDLDGSGGIELGEIMELLGTFSEVDAADMAGMTDEQRLRAIIAEVEAELDEEPSP